MAMLRDCFGLGKVALADSSFGLALDLHGEAAIAASEEEDLFKFKYHLESSADAEMLWIPWVKKSHRYRLILDVRLDYGQSPDNSRDVAEMIALGLKTSEAWLHLHLVASSVELTSHPAISAHTFTVLLDYANNNPPAHGKKPPSKLGRQVPLQDLQPPSKALQLELHEIRFSILLRRKSDPAYSPYYQIRTPLKDVSGVYSPLDDLVLLESAGSDEVELCPLCCISHVEGCCTVSREIDHRHDAELLLLDGVDDYQSSLSLSEMKPVLPMFTVVSSPRTDEIMQLLDLGLLLSIKKCVPKMPASITILAREFIPLERLAPVLWLPGYLQTVSHSFVFAPTIAHALDRIERKHAFSLYPDADSQDAGNSSISLRAIPQEANVSRNDGLLRLWHACQLSAFRSNKSRSLSTLLLPKETHGSHHDIDLLPASGDEDDVSDGLVFSSHVSTIEPQSSPLCKHNDNSAGDNPLPPISETNECDTKRLTTVSIGRMSSTPCALEPWAFSAVHHMQDEFSDAAKDDDIWERESLKAMFDDTPNLPFEGKHVLDTHGADSEMLHI